MHHLEIWRTISTAVQALLDNGAHTWSEHELLRRADELLLGLPTVGGTQPTASGLLRRYHTQLQHELCRDREPRALPGELDEQVGELTRAVMVTAGDEGISVEVAVLLGLAIQAGGLTRFCATPGTSLSLQ